MKILHLTYNLLWLHELRIFGSYFDFDNGDNFMVM